MSADGPENSGWYIVNIGFNNNSSLKAGNDDSKYPGYYARRNPINDTIEANQRVIGVYGYTRLADGGLRSLGLIIANEK